MNRSEIKTGQRFGRLVAIEPTDRRNDRSIVWRCKCDCGKDAFVPAKILRRGSCQSCGCLARELSSIRNRTHGQRGTRLYRVWSLMRGRCSRPSGNRYNCYGGRGITVCDEWKNSFAAFCEWARENGYRDDLEIDRIDVNGNYEPGNCRWATAHQQAANKTNSNKFVGVWQDKRGYFYAELMINRKKVLKASFKSYEEAVCARLDAEEKHGIVIERRGL